MRAVGRTSKMWVWGAVAALTIGMVGFGGPANAAPPQTNSAPAATASAAEPAGDDVTITYTINRAVKHGNSSVSCTLDGTPLVDCGTATTSAKKLTSYTLDLSGQLDGTHVFDVTFTLTDGGTATATAQFTITALQQACTELINGVVTLNPDAQHLWACVSATPYDGPQPGSLQGIGDLGGRARSDLLPFCPSGMVGSSIAVVDDFVIESLSLYCLL